MSCWMSYSVVGTPSCVRLRDRVERRVLDAVELLGGVLMSGDGASGPRPTRNAG